MGMIRGLALVLLTLVGYSSGAVLAGRGKQVLPGLLDLAVVVVLWAMALTTRAALGGGPALVAWLLAGLAVGAGLTRLRGRGYPDRRREPEPPASVRDTGMLRRWWEGWKSFAAEMGNYQGRVLLAFFYFVVVMPFGVSLRLFGDPLRLRRVDGSSSWLEREPGGQGLQSAREQF